MTASVSAADERALILWDRYNEQRGNCERIESGPAGEAQYGASFDVQLAIEKLLQADIGASVHALAAVLMIEIKDRLCEEEVDGLQEASLAAIRPQLGGAIGEAADRVLAKKEEEAA
jgi:hypothetical protein